MAFEKFIYPNRCFKPKISIRTNGQLGFSNGAVNKFKIKEYKLAVLFYDKNDYVVGIKLSNDDKEECACKLQIKEKNVWISAKSFFDYYEIDYKKTQACGAEWDDKNEMIILKINNSEQKINNN